MEIKNNNKQQDWSRAIAPRVSSGLLLQGFVALSVLIQSVYMLLD